MGRHTLLDESLDVGSGAGTPVTLSYEVPFEFTGTIGKAVLDLKRPSIPK